MNKIYQTLVIAVTMITIFFVVIGIGYVISLYQSTAWVIIASCVSSAWGVKKLLTKQH